MDCWIHQNSMESIDYHKTSKARIVFCIPCKNFGYGNSWNTGGTAESIVCIVGAGAICSLKDNVT